MPEAGQEETVRVVALDRSFHIACYKCEVSYANEYREKKTNYRDTLQLLLSCKCSSMCLYQQQKLLIIIYVCDIYITTSIRF